MENVPQIKLSKLSENKIKSIDEGTKIYDLETKSYYEKRDGSFQKMVEEEQTTEEIVSKPDLLSSIEDIKKLVASGDKLGEANAFMELKSLRNSLEGQKKAINEKINFMFDGTPEEIDLIQARVSEVTEDALEKATYEQLKEFFIIEGREIKLNFDPIATDEDRKDAYKQFLQYLKTIDSAVSELNGEISRIDEAIEYFSDEVKEKSKSLQVWDDYVYGLFRDRLNDESITEEEKTRINRLIAVKDDALKLSPIYDAIKAELDLGRRRSMIHAFKNRFEDTLMKAEKYAEKNNFHIYFQLFDGIEEMLGYADYRNFFVYLFARYIKFNQEKFSKIDNAFIAQITQNLILLKNGDMAEPRKTQFMSSIKAILELVIEP